MAGSAYAGTTYHVSTIAELQAAVDAVNAGSGGDTIVLAPGFYSLLGGGLDRLTIDQDVTIQGDPLSPTVLDGGGSIDNIFDVRADNLSLVNLTLQNVRDAIEYEGEGVFSATGLTITGSSDTAFDAGDSGGAVQFTNSTIAGNPGRGISVSCGELHMTNVTASDNGMGLYFDFPCGEQMTVVNSLIVRNGQDCGGGGGFTLAADASIDSDGSCVALTASHGGGPGFSTTNPQLGALAANGGPSMTEAIAASSPAVNAGDNAACPTVDQRGFLRADGACDIGAFELGATAPGSGNTQPGTNVTVSPAPGVTLTFSNVTVAGDTTATTGGPTPPTGFQVDGVVYDLTTSAVFSGPITVCLPYGPNDPNPAIVHFESGAWVNRTTSIDSANHIVCGSVSSLSPFAVLMPIDINGQLQQLQTLVDSFNLKKPVMKRFTHRLDEARHALAHPRHDSKKFCKELDDFMKDARTQTGKSLTTPEASQLLALAQQIAGEAGCSQ